MSTNSTPQLTPENTREIENTFFNELEKLLELCRTIISEKWGLEKQIGVDFLKYSEMVTVIKTKLRDEEAKSEAIGKHMHLFEHVYNRAVKLIPNTFDENGVLNDRWLASGKVTIEFGKGEIKNVRAVYLSVIYAAAKDIAAKAEKRRIAEGEINDTHIGYAHEILLYLFRIFATIMRTNDQRRLIQTVNRLESHLGIEEFFVPPVVTPGEDMSDPLKGFGNLISNALNMDEDAKNNLGKTVSQIVNGDASGNAGGILKGVVNMAKESGFDLSGAVNKMLGSAQNGSAKTGEEFEKSVKDLLAEAEEGLEPVAPEKTERRPAGRRISRTKK